jgi:hypothetical protein
MTRGRGWSRLSRHVGTVDSPTCSWAMKQLGCARRRAIRAIRSSFDRSEPKIDSFLLRAKADLITSLSRLLTT